MKKISLIVILLVQFSSVFSQKDNSESFDLSKVPVSNSDIGIFPFVKTFANFKHYNSSDSITINQNRAYFFDGKKYIAVDGKVSSQKLNIIDDQKSKPSEFQIIQDFDKIISTLGGKKIYTGELPVKLLKPIAGTDDIVSLYTTNQVVNSAHYGVVEYIIKTKDKEVWIQLQPYSIASNFYTVLIVEKQTKLIDINTNKPNQILKDLDKSGKSIFNIEFKTDSTEILTQSGDEILNIVNIFQVHPNFKLRLEVHNAPVGKPSYILNLTQKRAAEIQKKLHDLGVKSTQVETIGLGDTKPIEPNETEKSRIKNTRIEIIILK
jgi:OmpA-OmpF porin, OOP family